MSLKYNQSGDVQEWTAGESTVMHIGDDGVWLCEGGVLKEARSLDDVMTLVERFDQIVQLEISEQDPERWDGMS